MQHSARLMFQGSLATVLVAILMSGCSRDAAAPPAAAVDAANEDPGPGVTVDAQMQKRLGLEEAAVVLAPARALANGTAVVLDTAALVSTLDEIAAATEEAAAQRENMQRLQHLYSDGGNASLQALETARSQAATARAALTTAESRARVDWGGALIDAREPRLRGIRDQLAHGAAALLRAEFSGSISGAPASFEYSLPGDDSRATIAAQYVDLSKAPTQSASGLAVTLAVPLSTAGNLGLRPGLRLSVIAAAPDGQTRPLVPAAAVIADSGQLWCYVARPDGRFDRIALAADERVGAGYPAPALKAGDQVVVRGAPLLLSLERGAGGGASGGD